MLYEEPGTTGPDLVLLDLITSERQWIVVAVYFSAVGYMSLRSAVPLAFPLLTAPLFKNWIVLHFPIFNTLDYTIACALLVLLSALYALRWRREGRVVLPVAYLGTYALLTLILVTATPLSYPWATRALLQHIGFNSVGFLAPFLLIRRWKDVEVLLGFLIFTAFFVGLVMVLTPLSYSSSRGVFLLSQDSITAGRSCAYGVTLIAVLLPEWRARRPFSGSVKGAAVLVVAMSALVMSGSRGPFLQLGVAITFLAVVSPGIHGRRYLVSLLVLAVGIAAGYQLFGDQAGYQRIAGLGEDETYASGTSIGYRLNAWTYVLGNFDRAMMMGKGLGTLEFREGIQAHSFQLELLYSGGVLASLVFLWLVAMVLFRWWRTAHRRDGLHDSWLAAAAALAVHVLTETTTGHYVNGARTVYFAFSTLLMVASLPHRTVGIRASGSLRVEPSPHAAFASGLSPAPSRGDA